MREALAAIRAESGGDNTAAGERFEELTAAALREHPGEWGRDRFEAVWRWMEWPERENRGFGGDIGVDLVARQTQAWGGGLCAVQVKFREREIPTKEIDSFLAAAPENIFASAIVVTTADLSRVGMKKLGRRRGGKVLYADEMDSWTKDWREFLKRPVMDPPAPAASPRPHQTDALRRIRKKWKEHDRGQLILPCGTGKTLTALWAAEEVAAPGDSVLFLVPSLALMAQTMGEWSRHKSVPMQFLAICSDADVGKGGGGRSLSELFAEVTTSEEEIRERLGQKVPPGHIRAVFSTYQSSPRLVKGAAGTEFALAVFDEAHRTTGVESGGGFQTAMSDRNVRCRKRLFMTATPRFFTETQRRAAAGGHYDGEAYAMDSVEHYGPVFYSMLFSEAVREGLLSDYQVHVVAVGEGAHAVIGDRVSFDWGNIAPGYQPRGLKDGAKAPALSYNEALQLAGAWDALATPYSSGWEKGHVMGAVNPELGEAAGSALLYFNKVARSEETADVWGALTEKLAAESSSPGGFLEIGVAHVDGKTPAGRRARELDRLRRARRGSGRCEVISNVRVLTEGVDVPGLDAVVFMDPRTSDVDITQAVGRAMRTAGGKREGHIVIPVVVPPLADPNQILDRSAYRAVAAVVRALRSNDDRWTYWLSDAVLASKKLGARKIGGGKRGEGNVSPGLGRREMEQMALELTREVASKMVDMCGDRRMWPTWGKKAGEAAAAIEAKLRKEVYNSNNVNKIFSKLCDQMEEVCGGSTPAEVMEMVAHHIAIIPIFDAMFDEGFSRDNPVSAGIGNVIAALEAEGVSFYGERAALSRSYRRMREILAAADDAAESGGDPYAKADVIRQIYDGFIAQGMSDTAVELGVVYTPTWIVDFMLRSVDAVCREHFGRGADEGVRFLEPFCGTGTFPQRLLTGRRGDGAYLVGEGNLERTWGNLYGSEILMLPYYAAAVGCEEAYRRRVMERDGLDPGYEAWRGLTLQDSMLKTTRQWTLEGMGENVERAAAAAGMEVDVICTNPPWSAGSKEEGAVGKRSYQQVAARIRETYTAHLSRLGVKAAKIHTNLYVHALRWASDRLTAGTGGKVLAMVHPNSLLEGGSAAGVRAGLEEDFTDIYVVNLRGNAYKQGEAWRREGDKVFGGGSRSGVQITVAVADPTRVGRRAVVNVAECPEFLRLGDKEKWLAELGDVTARDGFRTVDPNLEARWTEPPDPVWGRLTALAGDEQMVGSRLDSLGITTGADYLFVSRSPGVLAERMKGLLDEYERLRETVQSSGSNPSKEYVDRLAADTSLVRSRKLKDNLRRGKEIVFDRELIVPVLYRPFTVRYTYADPDVLASYPVGLRDWPQRGTPLRRQSESDRTSTDSERARRPEPSDNLRAPLSRPDTDSDHNAAGFGGVGGGEAVPGRPAITCTSPPARGMASVLAARIRPGGSALLPSARCVR